MTKTKLKVEALRVLVVDDHAEVRTTILRNLKDIGFKLFDEAANIDEAFTKINTNPYNIVFLDVYMPGKTGYYLLEKCREDMRFANTAFIMVSSASERSAVIEALKAGANAFILKPVEEKSLKDYVTRIVSWLEPRIAR
ncbi:MAG: response regulator [Alphaproteobacteria bacterium]|nr:MAG: response regulator [Alphaproteobacteria bacterium]